MFLSIFMTQITCLDHIAIATPNLNKSLDFFETKLGLRCTSIEDLPERGLRVALLPIGDIRIELIEPLHGNSEISSFLAKRGPGIHHLAFETKNIQEDMKELETQGVSFTTKNPSPGAHGSLVSFIHPKNSMGILVELLTSIG